jgi:hypothetical protein
MYGWPRDERDVETFPRKRARHGAANAAACAGDHHDRA